MRNRLKIVFELFCICLLLTECAFNSSQFPAKDLEQYGSLYVFCEERESGLVYFVRADEPEKKTYFEQWTDICDYDPDRNTFLYKRAEQETEKIYEYDLNNNISVCLLQATDLKEYKEDKNIRRPGYYENGQFSFIYGDKFLIYDIDGKARIREFSLRDGGEGSGYWYLSDDVLLCHAENGYYELDICTGQTEMLDEDLDLGGDVFISKDGSMGCSIKDETLFGGGVLSWSVLLWNTQNYQVKKSPQGITVGPIKLSADNKYALFIKQDSESPGIYGLRLKDEHTTVLYESEDIIRYYLWGGE